MDTDTQTQEAQVTEEKSQDVTQVEVKEQQPEQKEKPVEEKSQDTETAHPHKLERDLANSKKTIQQLEAEKQASKATIEELNARVASLEKIANDAKTAKVASELKAAGCVDVEVAATLLDQFDSDLEKLKEAKPYLFSSSKRTSTTGKPVGQVDSEITTIADAVKATFPERN